MKTTLLILALSCVPCFAESPPARRPAALNGERLEHFLANPGPRVLERFDADKDGRLSDDEKAKARAAIENRAGAAKEKVREKLDANGDGKLDESERAKAREVIRNRAGNGIRGRLLKRFDADGDGKLSEDERAKARAAMQKSPGENK